jgi:hypothetical protein
VGKAPLLGLGSPATTSATFDGDGNAQFFRLFLVWRRLFGGGYRGGGGYTKTHTTTFTVFCHHNRQSDPLAGYVIEAGHRWQGRLVVYAIASKSL